MSMKEELATAFHDVPVWVWYAGVGATGILYVMKRRSASPPGSAGVTTLTPADASIPTSNSNGGVDTVAQYTVLQGEIGALQKQVQQFNSPSQPPVPPPAGGWNLPNGAYFNDSHLAYFDPADQNWHAVPGVYERSSHVNAPAPVTGGSSLFRPIGPLYGAGFNPMHALYADNVISLSEPMPASQVPSNPGLFDRMRRLVMGGGRPEPSSVPPEVQIQTTPGPSPSPFDTAGIHFPPGYMITPHEIRGHG